MKALLFQLEYVMALVLSHGSSFTGYQGWLEYYKGLLLFEAAQWIFPLPWSLCRDRLHIFRLKMHWKYYIFTETAQEVPWQLKCHSPFQLWEELHLLFFAEMGKNGSLTLCNGLIFRWINVTNQTQERSFSNHPNSFSQAAKCKPW